LGGYLGSDLTHALSDPAKGELYARALLRSGSERMPDFRLTNHEIDVIMEYLRYVDQTERQIIK
jgi:nitric oxide reductase subunit C